MSLYRQHAVDSWTRQRTYVSYAAFVVHPDSGEIRIFKLGDAASLDQLIRKARAASDAEAHSGGLGSSATSALIAMPALQSASGFGPAQE